MYRVALAAGILVGGCAGASADERFRGVWRGTYSCDVLRGEKMTLTIDTVQGKRIRGLFEFEIGASKGSFEVSGEVQAGSKFALRLTRWIVPLKGYKLFPLHGEINRGEQLMVGTLPRCREGVFQARYEGPATTSTARPQLPKPKAPERRSVGRRPDAAGNPLPTSPSPAISERETSRQGRDPQSPVAQVWAAQMKQKITELEQRGETDLAVWQKLEREIRWPPSGMGGVESELIAEFQRTKASVLSNAWIAEITAAPTTFSDGNIGYVLIRMDRPLKYKKWPRIETERVRRAGVMKLAAILRPKLEEAAALAEGLPATPQALRVARTAMVPIERFHQRVGLTMWQLDPDGVLGPMVKRIREIQADPAFIEAFRRELDDARKQQNPREATDNLVSATLGPNFAASPLAPLVADAREKARFAAIKVNDRSKSNDPSEPSAEVIRDVVYLNVREANAALEVQWKTCSSKLGNRKAMDRDPVGTALCLPLIGLLMLDGPFQHRLVSTTKLKCERESESIYICDYLVDTDVYLDNGKLMPPELLNTMFGNDAFVEMLKEGIVNRRRFSRVPGGWATARVD